MGDGIRWVGLDVHAHAVEAATFDSSTGELNRRTLGADAGEICDWLATLERPLRAVYEAGPSGYVLARLAEQRRLRVAVCSPGHVARAAADRVKTDRRDAERLARLYAAGELRLIRVPTLAEEGLRDLVRCREDVRGDLQRARQRLSKLLLRRGLRYPGPGSAWTGAHRAWLARVELPDRPARLTLADYLHAHDALVARRDVLDAGLGELASQEPFSAPVARLRCLRGIDTLSALGLCAEVGDFGRFSPRELAAFLGLTPSEHSSGKRRRQGAITKAGPRHSRRLLVEAAWHYRRAPHVSEGLHRRQAGQHPAAIEIAWRAQRRLHSRWQRLEGRRKPKGVVAISVARELACFCWEIATLGE